MILVHRDACAALSRRPEPKPLRLRVRDDQVRLEPAERRTADLSYSHEGRLVLVIDGETAVALDGQELVADPSPETAEDVRLQPRTPLPPGAAGEPA